MSDMPGAGSRPELTPEQESDVRRLLADARHDQPIPAEVGDRLDRVLAGLSRDDPGADGIAPVIDLAARRRRRNVAALLAGAAAVIVAGFAVGQVIDVGSSSDDGANSTAAQPADRDQAQSDGSDSGEADDSAGSAETREAPTASGVPVAPAPLTLSSATLEQDVTRQLRGFAADSSAEATAPQALSAFGCPPATAGTYGPGELFPALYDGEPAVLALRPPTGSTQRADVLACGTADELDSVTIPSP